MQGQIVCSGCRNLLLYPRGAANVRCALCHTVTSAIGSASTDMAQLMCSGCRVLLVYSSGAASMRCACCHTLNVVPVSGGQAAHITCGNCRTMLVYSYGAPSVKCSVCQYVTNVNLSNIRVLPSRPNGTAGPTQPSSMSRPNSQTQTVVVENPVSVDESGRLVSNIVVGVSTGKK